MTVKIRLRRRDDGLTPAEAYDRIARRMGWLLGKDEVRLADPAEWPAVGIVVPVYNAPKLLERCIEGLKATDYPGTLRVILVDNASTDQATIELLGGEKGVIRLDEPVGFSEAVNHGLRKLDGCKYHVLYNQDVHAFDPEWLRHLVRWMEHRPECGLCGPKLLYENGTIQHAGMDLRPDGGILGRSRTNPVDDPEANEYRTVPMVTGAVYCIRASVEEKLGLMDERYQFGCEDLEYSLRVAAQIGMEVWYVPTAELIHPNHGVQDQTKSETAHRVATMRAVSRAVYEAEWRRYCVNIGRRIRVAFVLPGFNSASGGTRVVGALARYLSNCGARAEVFVRRMDSDPDTEFPPFPIRPIDQLQRADIVVATRCDTLSDALNVDAKKRFYFAQQIEDCMSKNFGVTREAALASYRDKRFEIITIAPHLADRLAEMGRECSVLDVGFYRDLYPVTAEKDRPGEALMYGADGHKGPDNAEIARRLSAAGITVNTVHRYAKWPEWARLHFRPETTLEMAAVYGAHGLYVYASESDGLAMTPIEAMACGTPVVLSEFPGCEQYARDGENCLMARYRDPAHVAERAIELMADPDLRRRLVKGGLETADKYDWGNVGRQYARLLLEAHV